MTRDTPRLTTDQAAKRLGVKAATVYAYVSRGILESQPAPTGTGSTFSVDEIEALARRGRPRLASRSQALNFTIDTSVTSITQQQLSYRGLDVVALSRRVTFEQITDLLLTGSLPNFTPWPTVELRVPAAAGVFDHIGLATILAARSDPFRADLEARAVAQTARTLISAVVDSLPVAKSNADLRIPRLLLGDESLPHTIAGRLWTRLHAKRPTTAQLQMLNAALVLMADHELAVSAVAARVAASTRADPYAVVLAGIAAMSGPLHGGASRPARDLLDRATAVGVPTAVAESLATHGFYPGYGHKVYKHGDPRADALLKMLRAEYGDVAAMRTVDEVIATIWKRREIRPNIDFALAAFGATAGLSRDSGEYIFGTARIAGWVAHALEEYEEEPLRFRARANYQG